MARKTCGQAEKTLAEVREQLARIRRSIAGMDLVCRGTLSRRMKTCGQSTCRCHQDASARHGPYFEWTRMDGGRYVNTIVQPREAEKLRRAISNYKQIQGLLQDWSRTSALLIKAENKEG